MVLVPGCASPNPAGVMMPAPLAAAGAPPLAPMQGDHVFGDVIGTFGNALALVIGGGANFGIRLQNYNPMIATLWNGLAGMNLGHQGAGAPVVTRNGAPEPDEHSHVFGGLSARLQWAMGEICCTGFANGAEVRRVGGATRAWKAMVMQCLDDLLNHLVDQTALQFYLATPNGIRQANPAVVRHPPISLMAATQWVANNNGPGKGTLQMVLGNYGMLRNSVAGLFDRLDQSVKTLNPNNNSWA